jgi:hypothetical protein
MLLGEPAEGVDNAGTEAGFAPCGIRVSLKKEPWFLAASIA